MSYFLVVVVCCCDFCLAVLIVGFAGIILFIYLLVLSLCCVFGLTRLFLFMLSWFGCSFLFVCLVRRSDVSVLLCFRICVGVFGFCRPAFVVVLVCGCGFVYLSVGFPAVLNLLVYLYYFDIFRLRFCCASECAVVFFGFCCPVLRSGPPFFCFA